MTSTAVEFDPYDVAVLADPYPSYALLRDHAPLYHNEEHDFWALSRHADVTAAGRDDTTYSNSMGVSIDPVAWGLNARYAMSFLAMDPPEHTRLRALVSRGFTPRGMKELEPRIREIAIEYLDTVDPDQAWDFVEDFAGKLPMDVISEMVGVPRADRDEMRRLTDVMLDRIEGTRDVPPEGVAAAGAVFGYFTDLIEQRRRAPADDLTSALVAADDDGDRLSDEEVLAFLFLLIVAGNETTTKLLGNCVYWAARHPDQFTIVRADPTRIPDWVHETLRYDGSTQLLARYLQRDVDLHGCVAPAGAQLVLLLGAANRDPRAFPDADRYDITRDNTRLVSFGGGRHYCLGANLARLEARVALEELLARFGGFAVDEDGAKRIHSINVRGFTHLPITVSRR